MNIVFNKLKQNQRNEMHKNVIQLLCKRFIKKDRVFAWFLLREHYLGNIRRIKYFEIWLLLLHSQQLFHGVGFFLIPGSEHIQRSHRPRYCYSCNLVTVCLNNVKILMNIHTHKWHGLLDEVSWLSHSPCVLLKALFKQL